MLPAVMALRLRSLACSLSFRRHVRWVLILYAVQFLLVLPYTCRHRPFSPLFWTPGNNMALLEEANQLNAGRKEEARSYFANMDAAVSREWYKNVIDAADLFLVIPLVTVSRQHNAKGQGYLLQSASILDRMVKSHSLLARTVVFICNVDFPTEQHEDAQFVKNYLPYFERFGRTSFTNSGFSFHLNNQGNVTPAAFLNKYAKETADYIFCLQAAKSLNPDMILMLEDDALPHADFPEVLHHIVSVHLRSYETEQPLRDFAYVKLYYPQRWQGYSRELTSILELVSIGCVAGGLFALLYWLTTCQRQPQHSMALFYFVVGGVFTGLTAALAGRQNILELRRLLPELYSFVPSLPCCTQAMLYNPAVLSNMSAHLRSMPPGIHTDLAIYDFVLKSGIPAFQIEPNLFYHIGMYTSLAMDHKDPQEFLFHIS